MSAILINEIDENTTLVKYNNGSLEVTIRCGDISQESCDAIVNPTSTSMIPNGGLDVSVHNAMGSFFTDQVVAIYKDRQENACPVGHSRIFIAKFNREENDPHYVISTAGPVYSEFPKERATFLLKSCYYTALALANLYNLSSIAFPAISCGANGFPLNEAVRVAIEAIREYSFNIRDVRFVLFGHDMYKLFIEEWTKYAEQINRETNGIDQLAEHTSEPPEQQVDTLATVPTGTSTRYCVLCKEKALPIDRQLLCEHCVKLTRLQKFRQILSRLRIASSVSFAELIQECESLKPIFKSYPLNYTPTQVNDQSIHQIDNMALWYLNHHCDKAFRESIPLAILGDGNCFYNTFVQLGRVGSTVDESSVTAVELRARNVVELVLNIDSYKSQYSHLSVILDDFEAYVTTEMVKDSSYASVWDFFSMPTVLNIRLISIYPHVNGQSDLNAKYLNNCTFIPLSNSQDVDEQQSNLNNELVNREVRMLFSSCSRPLTKASNQTQEWVPNHFVPLLRYS